MHSLAVTAACQAGAEGQAPAAPASTPPVVSGAPDGPSPAADDFAADVDIEAGARQLLAGEDGEGEFKLLSAEPVQWSDASPGCPQDGFAYAQVITPGHKPVFELEGITYPVHSNADGSHGVVCGDRG